MAAREWNPGELLEISGFFWQTAALHAAVKLDVFTVVGDGQSTADEISRLLDGAPRGVERLLDALVAMDLLVKVDGKYANCPSGRTLLSKDSAIKSANPVNAVVTPGGSSACCAILSTSVIASPSGFDSSRFAMMVIWR